MNAIRSIPPLEALREEWMALAHRCGAPLLDHDWITAAARAFHRHDELRIVICRGGGEALAAAAPLVRRQTVAGPRLELIGMTALHEPGGFLADSDGAAQALVREVTALGEPLLLERLEAGGNPSRWLAAGLTAAGIVVRRETRPSLLVRFDHGWPEYERRLTTRITKNLPRLRRRAQRMVGPVRSEVLAPSAADVAPLLARVYAVEASGWKGRRGSALARQASLAAFFGEYAASAAQRGRLRLAQLWFGTRLAAVELAVVACGRWWQLKIGYEEALAEYYPGLQLTHETVRHAFDQGLEAYEFLGSAADWERRWNPVERRHEVALIYPLSLAGATGLVRDAVRRTTARFAGGPPSAHRWFS